MNATQRVWTADSIHRLLYSGDNDAINTLIAQVNAHAAMREALQACIDVIPPNVKPSPAHWALEKAKAALTAGGDA